MFRHCTFWIDSRQEEHGRKTPKVWDGNTKRVREQKGKEKRKPSFYLGWDPGAAGITFRAIDWTKPNFSHHHLSVFRYESSLPFFSLSRSPFVSFWGFVYMGKFSAFCFSLWWVFEIQFSWDGYWIFLVLAIYSYAGRRSF